MSVFKFSLLMISALILAPFSAFAFGPLASHEAEYELLLAEPPKSGVGLTSAGGVMKYKSEYTCEGWINSNSFILKLYYDGLGEESRLWNISTFESKDGLSMSFATQVSSDEEEGEVEKITGKASFPKAGREGRAVFSYPERISVVLPAGTMFPSSFNIASLAAAQKGQKNFSGLMFDGSGFDAVSEVNVFISPNSRDWRGRVSGDKDLLKGKAYNFSMAFFPYSATGEDTGIPSYEVQSVYFANGVAGEIVQDLGSFKIKAILQKIKRLPEPGC